MPSFDAGSIEATLDLDLDPFQRGIQLARSEARKFASEKYEAQLGVDTAGAMGQVAALRAELTRVATGTYTATIDLNGGAQMAAQLTMIAGMLGDINRTRATATVDVNGLTQALAEIQLLQDRLDALSRTRATASINADTSGFTSGIGAAGGRMQSLIALGALLAPALIPGLVGATAAAGGLTSALMAAGGALGVLAVAGIGNVMQVTGAQKDLEAATTAVASAGAAATAAQQGVASAARGVQAAEQGLANARRSAAQSVAAAESQLAQAQRGVKYAQDALNKARKDAAERLADYRDELRGAALDEEGAEIAVRRAFQAMQEAMADPNASTLDRDEARQAYQEALFNLDQVRESRDELQKQAEKDRKAGVKGSTEVKAARDRLRAAIDAERAAERAVADAKRAGAEQVAAAQQAVADANRNAAAAATAAAAASGALAEAEADRAKALQTLSTPAAEAFTAALDDAKGAWREFLAATRDSSLGVATRGLELFSSYLPDLAPVADAAADGVGRLFDRLDAWLEGGGMKAIVDFLVDEGPDMIESWGIIFGNIARWFGGVAVAFAPFARRMMRGLEDITDGWADWANELDNSDSFRNFIIYANENGPLFLDTLGSILDGLLQIGEAIAPAGVVVLRVLRNTFDAIADVDPMTLSLLIGVAGAILAFTAAPVAGAALAFVGLVAAVGHLADDSPALESALESIGDLFGDLWDAGKKLADLYADEVKEAWRDMQPDLENLAKIIRDDFAPAWEEFWEGPGGDVLRWFASNQGRAAGMTLRVLARGVVLLAGAVVGLLEVFNGIVSGDWEKFWRGFQKTPMGALTRIPRALQDMLVDLTTRLVNSRVGRAFGDMWTGIQKRAGDARDWLLDRLTRGDESMMGRLRSGFDSGIDAIGRIWDRLQRLAGTPVKFVVDTLYNRGIVPVINALPGVDDIKPVDTSKWPSFAKGGVLPGYSPGVDNHRFYSPTAGYLNLSGGEGILTPPTTKMLGGEAGLKYLEERARKGQLSLAALTEQSHATGGVVYVDGEPMSRVAAAQLAVAERASGIPMYVMQGSYQAASSYSGTSHTGGGVMDTGPGSFDAQSWLRKVAFAAWARNIPGAQYAGSGAHVHSVSRIDPAAAGHAQLSSWARGEDGLGHGDYGPNPAVDPNLIAQVKALAGSDAAMFSASGSAQAGGGNPMARFFDIVDAAKDFAKDAPGWLDKLQGMNGWGPIMRDMAGSIGESVAEYVNDKIPNRLLPDNPIPTGIFDTGGWLQPGMGGVNLGATPEAVLTGEQWSALSRVALNGASGGGGLSKGDVDRIVKAIEDNRSVHVEAPDQATGREVVELLAYELRK